MIPEAVRQYSSLLFGSSVDPDTHKIQRSRRDLDFPAVADKFRMISDDTCDVIVGYPYAEVQNIERLVEQLHTRERLPREVLRQLQPHTVSLFRREYDRLKSDGLVEEIDAVTGIGRWHGDYDRVRGIVKADPELIV